MAIVNEEKYGNDGANTLVNDKKGYTYMSGLEGNDTYVIENISKSFTEIDDSDRLDESENPGPVNVNGIPTTNFGNDTIQIKNVKANDLSLFFDVSLAPNVEETAPSDELYIVKKSAMSSVVKQVLKLEDTWAQYEDNNPGLTEDEAEALVMQKAAPQSGAVYIPYQFGDTNNAGSQMSASAIEKIQVVDGKTGVTKTLDLREYIAEVKEEVVELLQEVNGLGLRNYYDELITSAFQLVNSKHTKYKNKLFNLYKSEEFDITIEGTSSSDKLVGEDCDNTFVFREGSGHDTITSSKGDDDTLKFEGINEVEYRNNKNDLIIYYGSDNSVIIKNYLKNPLKSPIEYIELGNSAKTRLYDEIEIDVYGTGKKSIAGTKLEDNIYGTDVAETIKASDGDDDITANGGDDKLYGGSGENDFYFSAGDGNDVVYYDKNAQDTLNFVDVSLSDLHIEKGKYNGIKIVTTNGDSVELANYLKKGQTSVAEIYTGNDDTTTTLQNFLQGKYLIQNGNEKNNKLTGTNFADELYGNDGKDTLSGGNSDDYLYGGTGNDTLKGGNGDDYLYGDAGNDTLKGGNDDDHLYGGADSDKLYGEGGVNTFHFNNGDGNDTIYMGKGADKIVLEDAQAEAPTYSKNGNNLVINYGDDDSITIANYFKSKSPSVKTVDYEGITDDLAGDTTLTRTDDIIIKGQLEYDVDYGKFYYYQGNEKNNLIYANSKVDEIDTGDGDNTVYINSKVEAGVFGGSGNDTYHVNSLKSFVYLNDFGGTDKLVINEKASNINVIFEVNTTGEPIMDPYSSMLILNDSAYNKLKKGGFEIVPENITSGIEVADGDSSIEYIYSKDNKMIDVEQLKGQVAGWLSRNGYSSAMQVIEYGQENGDLSELLNVYQNAWVPAN